MPSTLSCITGGQIKPKVLAAFSSLHVVLRCWKLIKKVKRRKEKGQCRGVDKRQARRHVIISIFNGVLNPRTSFISSLGHEDKTWPSFNWFITCVKGEGGGRGAEAGPRGKALL